MQELVWVTRNGDRIPVSQMTDSHIRNCIRMIYRSNGRWRRQYLHRLELELEIRSLGLNAHRPE